MAAHEAPILITAAQIRDEMERRLLHLYTQDQYNGQYAGECEFHESILADTIMEEDESDSRDGAYTDFSYVGSLPDDNAAIQANVSGQSSGRRGGVSRPVAGTASSPRLLYQ
jgi:hypothetical protein